jgi:hypothetical protein
MGGGPNCARRLSEGRRSDELRHHDRPRPRSDALAITDQARRWEPDNGASNKSALRRMLKNKFWRSSRFPGQRFTGSKKRLRFRGRPTFRQTGDVGLKARSRIGRARLTSAIRGVAGATAVAPVPQAKYGWLSDVRCCSHNGLKSDIASCRVCAISGLLCPIARWCRYFRIKAKKLTAARTKTTTTEIMPRNKRTTPGISHL